MMSPTVGLTSEPQIGNFFDSLTDPILKILTSPYGFLFVMEVVGSFKIKLH